MSVARLAAPHPDVVVADFETELVVLVPSRRRAHLLEPMWAIVFDSCRRGDTVNDVVDELEDAMGSNREDVAAWVDSAITSLTEAGVLLNDE